MLEAWRTSWSLPLDPSLYLDFINAEQFTLVVCRVRSYSCDRGEQLHCCERISSRALWKVDSSLGKLFETCLSQNNVKFVDSSESQPRVEHVSSLGN